jgi:hypothetical protein
MPNERLDLPQGTLDLLILLNARQNLRQYKYARVLEHLLRPEARQ